MSLEVSISEIIPNEHHVFRNVHCAQYNKWIAKRIPNESDFSLKPNEDGLSVNWQHYCNINEVFILLGTQKNKKQEFRNPKEFKVIKFNVGDLRNLNLLIDNYIDVKHDPQVENYAHSLVCYRDDEEVRLKLCDMVSSLDPPLLSINFDDIEDELEVKRKATG